MGQTLQDYDVEPGPKGLTSAVMEYYVCEKPAQFAAHAERGVNGECNVNRVECI